MKETTKYMDVDNEKKNNFLCIDMSNHCKSSFALKKLEELTRF